MLVHQMILFITNCLLVHYLYHSTSENEKKTFIDEYVILSKNSYYYNKSNIVQFQLENCISSQNSYWYSEYSFRVGSKKKKYKSVVLDRTLLTPLLSLSVVFFLQIFYNL